MRRELKGLTMHGTVFMPSLNLMRRELKDPCYLRYHNSGNCMFCESHEERIESFNSSSKRSCNLPKNLMRRELKV
jgi:hypothetical protein